MSDLDMENKCILNPKYISAYQVYPNRARMQKIPVGTSYRLSFGSGCVNQDIFVKRPDAYENASGLFGFKRITNGINNYFKDYKKNIQHTFDHKVVFALVERELFGKTSVDSLTHDADKMVLYLLGFPKSFVSKYHRVISVHHPKSGKKMNLRSMLCDNIASSPEFKPEKKKSVREYYSSSTELQAVSGFKELLEKYNFGENLDFNKIKAIKAQKYRDIKGFGCAVAKMLMAIIL